MFDIVKSVKSLENYVNRKKDQFFNVHDIASSPLSVVATVPPVTQWHPYILDKMQHPFSSCCWHNDWHWAVSLKDKR